MPTPILATKLYVPPLRPEVVSRPRLLAQLNEGLHRKLILISAPAGFGKTTLISERLAWCERPAAWLSLDAGDGDPIRFLMYLAAALQTIAPHIGDEVLGLLQSPQPPPPEAVLIALLNDLATIQDQFVLVLDDYHVLEVKAVDQALTFLLEHLPPHMHLVIATREDPGLPLARFRAGDQMIEIRITDLRFTHAEAAAFLNRVMSLGLSAQDIVVLEQRTEGWIAGLQLAALSLQGQEDATSFIRSFTGLHHFVLDYLVEEVLGLQSESIQQFLLRTSILDRFCAPLCDAVVLDPSISGQTTLAYLERANLFLVPLDDERRWYRYHQLFAELLRQRLASSPGDAASLVNELHLRASTWYEEQGLDIEAFGHATAAHDIERARRLVEGKGMPLQFRGAVTPVPNWLRSLPEAVLDAWPSLWVMYASALSMTGQLTGVEEKLQAAEAALQGAGLDDRTRNLIGHIAAIRARRAYTEAIVLSEASNSLMNNVTASIGLGLIQEADTQLYAAAETYQRVLHLVGESPLPAPCEAHLGLARIGYEWNSLDEASQHAQQGIHLARLIENADRIVAGEVLLARLKLTRGDVAGASALLAGATQSAQQHNFVTLIPAVAATQVLTLLRQGNLAAAAHLAHSHELPLSQARVHLAQGDPSTALEILSSWRQQVEAKGWQDERLKAMVLQALALQAYGDRDQAVELLLDALALAEPDGFIRLFVDEGLPMARLLSEAAASGRMPDYIRKLLTVFRAEEQQSAEASHRSPAQLLLEPLSERELEVLGLIAQGLSNQEISERLYLALDTVKGHNRKIFGKLQVERRTEAVARARELGLL
jgi:LuxR family transcriptional regulator, maltose regulon positive regulatory protein